MRTSDTPPVFVSDVATVDLIALVPADNASRARELQFTLGIHALPVMEGNDVVGIVTSTDLIDNCPDDTPVTAIMTPVPTSIRTDATVRQAAERMISNRTHHLLVHDDREVVGIVSSFDLLEALTAGPAA